MDLPQWKLLLTSIACSLLSMFFVGYSSTEVNTPEAIFQQILNDSFLAHYVKNITSAQETSLFALEVNFQPVGGVVGAFVSGTVINYCGLKVTLFLICNAFVIVGTVLQSLMSVISSFEIFIVGRFIGGVANGLITACLPVYLCECTPVRFRGQIGSLMNVLGVSSLFFGSVFSLRQVLGVERLFPYMLALPGIIAFVEMSFYFLVPDSPKRLYLGKRKKSGIQNKELEANNIRKHRAAAEKSLTFFHGPSVHTAEVFAQFEREAELDSGALSIVEVLKNKNLHLPMLLAILVNVGTYTTGLQANFNFSLTVMKQAGLSQDQAGYAVMGAQAAAIPGTIAATLLIERVGRRPLTLFSLIGCIICDVGFLIFPKFNASWAQYLTIACMVAFMFIIMAGVGTTSWFIASELFPYSARPVGSSIALTFNYLTSLSTAQIYLPTYNAIGSYVFLLWIVPTTLITIFLYFYLPETTGKSSEEIAGLFEKKSSNNNGVKYGLNGEAKIQDNY